MIFSERWRGTSQKSHSAVNQNYWEAQGGHGNDLKLSCTTSAKFPPPALFPPSKDQAPMETGTGGDRLGLGTYLPLCCCAPIWGMPQTSAQPVTQHLYEAALVLDSAFLRHVSKSKRSWWTKGICEHASIQMLATARAGISATSVTHIWKIFLYPCLFICISHFWLQAFNQHQCGKRETCIAVGVLAVAQNVWGMGRLLLPARVSLQSLHSGSAWQPPSDLLQLMSLSAVATAHVRPAVPTLAISMVHTQPAPACTGAICLGLLGFRQPGQSLLQLGCTSQANYQFAFAFCFSARTKLLGGRGTQSHLLPLIGRIKVSLVAEKHKTSSINCIKGSYEAGQIAGFVPQWSGNGQISLMSSTEATSTQKLSLFRKGRPVSPTILEQE